MVATYVQAARSDAHNTVTTHEGGQAYQIDAFGRLRRFLILGTEGGTFYVGEQELTKDNAKSVNECLKQDPFRTIDEIVRVSDSGNAAKNDPALFALAMAASFVHTDKSHQAKVRAYALEQLPRVARTGTHLFHFIAYVQEMRGWGSGLRNAVAKWYLNKDSKSLAYQVIKYQSRDGFSHRDVLRLCHAKPTTNDYQKIFKYVTEGEVPQGTFDRGTGLELLQGVDFVHRADTNKADGLATIKALGLPREAIPTQWLNDPDTWEALLDGGKMPIEAMIRNLGTMSKVGLTTPFSEASKVIVSRLGDEQAIRKSRLHPIKLLSALRTYQQGHGVRSTATWKVDQQIVSALDRAFYLAFDNVEPAGVNVMLNLDVSSSMMGGEVAGVPGLSPRVASVAMALVSVNVEPNLYVYGFSHRLIPLNIYKGQTLEQATRYVDGLPFGGTYCHLPMEYAMQNKLPVDAFIIYTDAETRGQNPAAVLRQYRATSGRNAAFVNVGMVANELSTADPKDARSLDVCGFDASAPKLISDFMAGRL